MANAYNSTIRNARMNTIVTEAGASAIGRLYNGTRPASLGTLSGNTLIAEFTGDTVVGTVTGGVLTFTWASGEDAALASGTPTFLRLFKSDGTTIVSDHDLSGAPACTSGQPVTDGTPFTLTEGNA